MSDSSPVAGILEIHDKGYGFLRKPERGSAPTPQDVFVPPDMIKRNALRDGVQLSGISVSNGRGPQLIELQQVNERAIDLYRDQLPFEELTTINPNRWIKLENGADKLSTRVLDLMTPIGHGQRGLIVASPRSGKTMLMQAIADGVLMNSPDTFVMIVLIDERPEEVTDFRQFLAGRGEIWSSRMTRKMPATCAWPSWSSSAPSGWWKAVAMFSSCSIPSRALVAPSMSVPRATP